MNNFTFYVPTKVHFGKGQISHLSELKERGDKVLMVYGGGSIKRQGLYDEALAVLKGAGITVYELPGVDPNPRIESVRRGVELCKAKGIHMVLAVGGGSTIDCAKAVAAGSRYDGDPWDLVLDPGRIREALPVYVVLTIAATGSEMDCYAVISDYAKHEKWDTFSPCYQPTMSILDPGYTCSVPPRQTAAGAADIFSHVLEVYFTNVPGAYVQARMCEALMQTVVHYGPIALRDPENYEARSNLMWASSLALNGLLFNGSEVSWSVHPIEHELSAFYDITHGVGLAILTPHWMDFALNERTAPQFAQLGRAVWGVSGGTDMEDAQKAIARTRAFFAEDLGLPRTLAQEGINGANFAVMAAKAERSCGGDCFVPLYQKDILGILEASR